MRSRLYLSSLLLVLALGCAQPSTTEGPAALGASLRTADSSDLGALLLNFEEDGPAVQAGLRPGDRLLTFDGTTVDGPCTLDRLLDAGRRGQKVTLRVRRGAEVLERSVTLANARELHAKECAAGKAAGCFELGLLQVKGKGTPIDSQRALQFFDQACQAGSAAACTELGARYFKGFGGTADKAKVLPLLRRACDLGDAAGCAHLAYLYATGQGSASRDDDLAFRLYQTACDGGDASGCYNVGLHFEKARGTPENSSLALLAYGRACELGDSLGCTNLAFLHEHGLGSPEDPEHVAEMYRRACEGSPCNAGDPLGCFNLGVFYRDGKGVPVDKVRASALFERSCTGHNALGCANLAELLEAGDGVSADKTRALDLYREACEGGHALACRITYASQVEAGTPEKGADALERLEQGCREGELAACYQLGTLTADGVGVAKNPIRAHDLFKHACEGGDEDACARLH